MGGNDGTILYNHTADCHSGDTAMIYFSSEVVTTLDNAAAMVVQKLAPHMVDHWADLAYDVLTISKMGIGDDVFVFGRANGSSLYRLGEYNVDEMVNMQSIVNNTQVVSVKYEADRLIKVTVWAAVHARLGIEGGMSAVWCGL